MKMYTDLCNLGTKPLIAEFALFSTDFDGVEKAMEWIYEAEEGAESGHEQMQHPFVKSLPTNVFTQSTNIQYLD